MILDTHALVWLLEDDPRMGPTTRARLDLWMHTIGVSVSAGSFWELALLLKRKRLCLSEPLSQWHERALDIGINEIPVTSEIAMRAVELEDLHRDPSDRIIVATAQTKRLPLVTADEHILKWQGDLYCHDART